MRIEINDDWYIQDDQLCYQLHDTRENTITRNGETKTTRGDKVTYYMNVADALDAMCTKTQMGETRSFIGKIEDYIERITEINNELKRVVDNCKIVKEVNKK